MKRIKIRHAHQSSRYDRSPRTLLANVRRLVRRHDLLTYTELAEEARAAMLSKVEQVGSRRGRGFKNSDDCAVVWRRKRWDSVATYTDRLTNIGMDWRPAPPSAIFVILRERKTGLLVLVTVAHLATQVETAHGWSGYTEKVRQHKDSTSNWDERIEHYATKHEVDVIMAVADWNLDVRLAWVRNYLADAFPTLRLTWLGNLGDEGVGTHGRRIIDATLLGITRYGAWNRKRPGRATAVKATRVDVLAGDASSDHRAYSEVIDVTYRPEEPAA